MTRKQKIKFLKEVIAELKDIQLYCKEKGLSKRVNVKTKLAYANSLKEYIESDYSGVSTHKGRLGDTYMLGDGVRLHYLIEESCKKDICVFVRRLNNKVFNTIAQIEQFRYLRDRICD